MGERATVARMLALAELEFRRAQQAHDGSEGARRRYASALAELERVERLAVVLLCNRSEQTTLPESRFTA